MSYETLIRLSFFVGGLVLFSILEKAFPRRPHTKIMPRILTHAGISVISNILLRVSVPLLAFEAAMVCSASKTGLFNQFLVLPSWLEFILSILIMDLLIYFQHRIFHAIPWLWRLHRMHHTDTFLDASSALRFHPVEIVISMYFKVGAVYAFGLSPASILTFEVLLNLTAMFNHANWNLGNFDYVLRKILVTPDFHRVHHSTDYEESMSNFGFCFSIWDYLFSTYRKDTKLGQLKMVIGQEDYRSKEDQRIGALLRQPLRK